MVWKTFKLCYSKGQSNKDTSSQCNERTFLLSLDVDKLKLEKLMLVCSINHHGDLAGYKRAVSPSELLALHL